MKLYISALFSIMIVYGYQSSQFAEQAVLTVRNMNVSIIDSKLPSQSFENWLKQITGEKSGISWQLTDCGNVNDGTNVQACVETTAVLLDQRIITILTKVGNFKQGIIGTPSLHMAVVDINGELYSASNLHSLPDVLNGKIYDIRDMSIIANNSAKSDPKQLSANTDFLPPNMPDLIPSPTNAILIITPIMANASDPPPSSSEPASPPIQQLDNVSEGVLQGNAIKKVLPVYPMFAKSLNIYGEVKVEVLIDSSGNVVKAKAISGPQPLHSTSILAAKKWIFKPTILNGAPISVQGVLSFNYVRQ